MSIQKSLEKMTTVQSTILNFLDNEDDANEEFQQLLKIFNDPEIKGNKYILIEIFHLITKIVNNHYRGPLFFEKIEKIIIHFKDQIKNLLSNSQIFKIFNRNKRLLLFLIEEKIITVDDKISEEIVLKKQVYENFPQYFAPEIKDYVKENKEQIIKSKIENDDNYYRKEPKIDWIDEVMSELPKDFYEKRRKGENDSSICKLIQKDLVKEFIIYINQKNYSIDSRIKPSIFETNSFLLKKLNINDGYYNDKDDNKYLYKRSKDYKDQAPTFSLIEYAAFFGSIQIFQYLLMNGAKLTDLLWFCVIHGKNAEIIHLLESNVEKKDSLFKMCLLEAIKCHHNDIAKYFQNNLQQGDDDFSQKVAIQSIKFYNFDFLQSQNINDSLFYNLCKYDHCLFVDELLKDENFVLEKKTILKKKNYLMQFYVKINDIN